MQVSSHLRLLKLNGSQVRDGVVDARPTSLRLDAAARSLRSWTSARVLLIDIRDFKETDSWLQMYLLQR